MNTASSESAGSGRTMTGAGRVLVAIYGILALAATARSLYQLAVKASEAPLAYSLSAVAAVVYIVATIALARAGRSAAGRTWYHVAVGTVSFELLGVLVVGALSIVAPELFQHASVWSTFGIGYGFVPLVLPALGLWWLARHSPVDDGQVGAAA